MNSLQQLSDEKPMSLPDAADYIGRLTGGKKPNVSTLWRWCLKGCKGVRLASICIGSKRYVTVSAIARFIEERSMAATPATPQAMTAGPPVPQATPRVMKYAARRREEIEAARRRVDELTGVTRRQAQEPGGSTT